MRNLARTAAQDLTRRRVRSRRSCVLGRVAAGVLIVTSVMASMAAVTVSADGSMPVDAPSAAQASMARNVSTASAWAPDLFDQDEKAQAAYVSAGDALWTREPAVSLPSAATWPEEALLATELMEEPEEERSASITDCDRWLPLITDDEREWDPEAVVQFMWRESGCDPEAVSPTNDWGLLQLNATCWAGVGDDRLPDIDALPADVAAVHLLCDGAGPRPLEAQWCYRDKESDEPMTSPCDEWLKPEVNVAVAYDLWQRSGWLPWCFNDSLLETKACRMAADENV